MSHITVISWSSENKSEPRTVTTRPNVSQNEDEIFSDQGVVSWQTSPRPRHRLGHSRKGTLGRISQALGDTRENTNLFGKCRNIQSNLVSILTDISENNQELKWFSHNKECIEISFFIIHKWHWGDSVCHNTLTPLRRFNFSLHTDCIVCCCWTLECHLCGFICLWLFNDVSVM